MKNSIPNEQIKSAQALREQGNNMAIKIEKKIVGYEVVGVNTNTAGTTGNASPPEQAASTHSENPNHDSRLPANVVQMHEKVERPETLLGSTYKIKTPLSEHALYVTINDIVLNPETPYEKRRPFEIFINSKNMDNFQWILALTRIVSAVFRKGGDVTFLVEELRSVFDPKGGYFKKGGKYMPSLVAEIGDAIETHMKMIGMLPSDQVDERQKKLIEEKKQEFIARQQQNTQAEADINSDINSNTNNNSGEFPAESLLCSKCQTKAIIMMDGCMTCLSCGDSKCG